MQRQRQIGLAIGLALALHVGAAVTTAGFFRYRTRHLTSEPAVVPVMLEWMAAAPAVVPAPAEKSDISERPDKSDKSVKLNVPAPAVVPPPEPQRPPPAVVKETTPPPAIPKQVADLPKPENRAPALPLPDKAAKSDQSDQSAKIAASPQVAAPVSAVAARATEPAGAGLPPAVAPERGAAAELHTAAAYGPFPVALADIRPRYPRSARMQGQEGRVVVRAVIDDTGHSERLEVCESSGRPALDQAALEAVRNARFRPATRDGVPVAGEIRLPFEFRLQ